MDNELRAMLFQALLVHAGNDGRAEALFGSSYERARQASDPFMVGSEAPSTYLEFPLSGEPFLDLTFLYGKLEPGVFVDHPAVAGTEAVFEWFASVCPSYNKIAFGFELDTEKPEIPTAAIHFQPREDIQLVQPFCDAVGEPERGALYLDMAKRMPPGWPLSFFGMFRGRPGAPLRVCGYLDKQEQDACAQDPQRLQDVFDHVGFGAYDERMLEQVRTLLDTVPGLTDFQLDVYPDGQLGDVFAIDVNFAIEQPEQVCASFESGVASHVVRLFQEWGIADDRVKMAPDLAFARGLPWVRDDGSTCTCMLTLFPVWAKVRWRAGVLQPAKLYACAKATIE